MSGYSDYVRKALQNWLAGAQAMPALPSVWLALFTAVGTDAGSGFTEVSGGAYARQQIAGALATNNTTANGNATLHFASVPAWIVAGMFVYDATAPSVLGSLTVLSVTSTTVVLSGNAGGAGVGNGDTIAFSAFNPAAGSSPSSLSSAVGVTFPVATADWTGAGASPITAFGLYDAATSGNLLDWDYLGNYAWQPATVSSASPGVLTAHAHGFSVGDALVYSTEYGGTAPTFSQSNFTGVLKVAHAATDTLDVTNAATAVNTSATGNGLIRKVAQQLVPTNVQVSFAGGALVVI